jgi:hypothetical protein
MRCASSSLTLNGTIGKFGENFFDRKNGKRMGFLPPIVSSQTRRGCAPSLSVMLWIGWISSRERNGKRVRI